MRVLETRLSDIKVIELDCHNDHRGFFMEIYNEESFKALGIDAAFVQDNCSFSAKKGVVRGLHFQKYPFAQAKLIRCTRGSFYDLAVDVRKGSPTFGQASVIELKENDHKLVFIPRGFAHGVAILEDGSEYNYKVDNVYNGEKENNGGISCLYDAKEIDLDKLLPGIPLILSSRDTEGVSSDLEHLDTNFIYKENC